MEGKQTTDLIKHNYLSFGPLVNSLRKNIQEGNPGMKKLYGQVLSEMERHPELLQAITEPGMVLNYSELIEELLSAVFPPTTANLMYGVSLPFKMEAVYASPLFSKNLVKPDTNEIELPETQIGLSLTEEKLNLAYGLILKKYLHFQSPDTVRSIYPYIDQATGLTRYMELRIDARFIDVKPKDQMPELPASLLDPNTNRLRKLDELMKLIPLDNFVFEGLAVMRINDVTEQAVISEMKNRLLDFDSFSDNNTTYNELEKFVESLIGIKGLKIGITPFFKINGHYVYSEIHNANSILFRNYESNYDKDEVSDYCKLLFRDNDQPLLFEKLDEKLLSDVQCLNSYYKEGARSLILCPLKQKNDLIGILEIMSFTEGELLPIQVSKVDAAIPLFTLSIEKALDQLNSEVDKVIKKKFTAVQPSVEWKFTEVALDHIVKKHLKKEEKVQRIVFEEVAPLYSAIDIRNSSTERSRAIQLDMIEQLEMAQRLVKKAQEHLAFPLLQEIEFKIEKFIANASDVLQSEEEMSINEFMKGQVTSVFSHLHKTEPLLKNDIEQYFSTLDPQLGMLYRHRREYEQSVTRINETLSKFLEKEQAAAQKVYPHYFERFVTDGLEFNIYMGQSITPRKKFDEIYLRNLKMWQLTAMAKAARLTHKLEAELSHCLKTTQLILCHNQTLSVLFRTEERKFDVDGTYNIRYEIVKKRIDKVRIKDSSERLTQPGKIAVVYSQSKDAAEYIEYIEFLQSQQLLKPPIEKHDLEELQGVSGLKALRVDVNFEEAPVTESVELSQTTSEDLIKNN